MAMTPSLIKALLAGVLCLLLGACGGSRNAGGVEDGTSNRDQVPEERGGAPAVWLEDSERFVLFGGMSPITDDTWHFDPSQNLWTASAVENLERPSARCHHTFISTREVDLSLLFGGFSFARRFNDVWEYDGATQRWNEISTSGTRPERRCLHMSAFIVSTGQMLVYGGIQGAGTLANDYFSDTHLFDQKSSSWQRLDIPGPGNLRGAVAFYSTSDDAVYMWGGLHVNSLPNELWRFEVESNTWAEVATRGDRPAGREDPIYFWDDQRSQLFIASGASTLGAIRLLDDAYLLDLSTLEWQELQLSPRPGVRWRPSVSYSDSTSTGFVFGGWLDFGGNDSLNDTWSFDFENRQWSQFESGGS